MYTNESIQLAMPKIKNINKYQDSESVNEVLALLFTVTNDWYDAPTACWAVMTVHALLQQAEKCREHRGESKVRVIFTLPDGEGYSVFEFCPHKKTAHGVTLETIDSYDDWEHYLGFIERDGVYMSKRLNEMMYISEWKDCEEHSEKPDLKLVHDQEEVEVVDFSESIDILNKLSIYSESSPEV